MTGYPVSAVRQAVRVSSTEISSAVKIVLYCPLFFANCFISVA